MKSYGATQTVIGFQRPSAYIDAAQKLREQRRFRNELIAIDLFADPAWDMLIELFIADDQGFEMSTTNFCLAAGVPVTTALRYVRELADRGVIARAPDPTDGRRIMITLMPAYREKLRRYFAQLMEDGAL